MFPGLKIVILLSVTQFQVHVPQLPSLPLAVFPDTPAGIDRFAQWLRPHWSVAIAGEHAPVFCVVGAEPHPTEHSSAVMLGLQLSSPPFSSFEPFSVSIRLISEFEQQRGVTARSIADAVAICNGERLLR
jgi:hypothetical protein